MEIRPLRVGDVAPILAGFDALGWQKPRSQLESYLTEQDSGARAVLVAAFDSGVAGYLNVVWEPKYPPFRAAGIPEIQDFNVFGGFRRRGIGTALMDAAEKLVATRCDTVGIGFGLDAGYGTAQRMYVRRGYLPDGRGVVYDGQPVPPGAILTVDDAAALMLTKRLR